MSDIARDMKDLEDAAVLLEDCNEEFVNPPTADSNRQAAGDVRRIANTYQCAVEALRAVAEYPTAHRAGASTGTAMRRIARQALSDIEAVA